MGNGMSKYLRSSTAEEGPFLAVLLPEEGESQTDCERSREYELEPAQKNAWGRQRKEGGAKGIFNTDEYRIKRNRKAWRRQREQLE